MRLLRGPLLAAALIAAAAPAMADGVRVVASIKPVSSLVGSVMAGVDEPTLIVRGGGSPHSYALRPSDAEALQQAAVVFWVGEGLEAFLAGTIETLAADAVSVELAEVAGIVLLPVREGGAWDAPARDEADHGDNDDGHGGDNPHVWLDPHNAAAMVGTIVAVLAEADPANAEAYRANGAATLERIAALTAEIESMLAPVADEPFVVFHDAYRYLERRFGLNAVGAITVSPEVRPGAGRVLEIRERIESLGTVCVFAEPQFAPALVDTLIEGTTARAGVLDPLGADIEDGPDQYFTLMRRNAAALRDCLAGVG